MSRVLQSLLGAAVALSIAACGSPGGRERVGAGDWPGPVGKPGGYYQDDGPHGDTPSDLDRTPDAVPRQEPLNPGNLRPYEVLGKRYVPFTSLRPYRERGIASWYGKKFHGNRTANGERYDMFAMSAAHTLLPLPSYARVTNLANGRSVIVRVNDRGPFHRGRIIDLSYAAAHKLGLVGRGSGEVIVESILPGDSSVGVEAGGADAGRLPPAPIVAPPADRLATLAGETGATPISDNASPGYYVQLGAFGNPDNALSLQGQLARELDWLDRPVGVFRAGGVHRVQVGPYAQRGDAERMASRIGDALGVEPSIAIR